MYKIYFYKDRRGKQPAYEYLQALAAKKDKDSRIKLNKHNDYLQALAEYGLKLGEPYIKHLQGELWELRPLRDRSLFAAWEDNGFVILHSFVKKTQKTPRREIEKAFSELADLKERWRKNEK